MPETPTVVLSQPRPELRSRMPEIKMSEFSPESSLLAPAPPKPAPPKPAPAPALEKPASSPESGSDNPSNVAKPSKVIEERNKRIEEAMAKANAPRPGEEPPAAEATPENVPRGTNPPAPAKVGFVKELKTNLATAQSELETARAEISRLKTSIVPEQERTVLTENMAKLKARNEELENSIRFKDYEQSEEFKTKYHAPYEQEVRRALSLLNKIPVIDAATGQQRAANEQDLFALMALDPVAQQQKAEELFGPLAGRVVAHAEKVTEIMQTRQQALDDAKTKGAERETLLKTEQGNQLKMLANEIKTNFEQIQAAVLADPVVSPYFKPREVPEGKQPTPEEKEWNDALTKGFSEFDKWSRRNPREAGLTPEQRREIVKQHVSLRNMAAGWRPLRRENTALKVKLAKLEKDLAKYEQSSPTAAGSAPANGTRTPSNPREARDRRIEEVFRKLQQS
jgi:hypothetical protein